MSRYVSFIENWGMIFFKTSARELSEKPEIAYCEKKANAKIVR